MKITKTKRKLKPKSDKGHEEENKKKPFSEDIQRQWEEVGKVIDKQENMAF